VIEVFVVDDVVALVPGTSSSFIHC
jgi:hypothetical protein